MTRKETELRDSGSYDKKHIIKLKYIMLIPSLYIKPFSCKCTHQLVLPNYSSIDYCVSCDKNSLLGSLEVGGKCGPGLTGGLPNQQKKAAHGSGN